MTGCLRTRRRARRSSTPETSWPGAADPAPPSGDQVAHHRPGGIAQGEEPGRLRAPPSGPAPVQLLQVTDEVVVPVRGEEEGEEGHQPRRDLHEASTEVSRPPHIRSRAVRDSWTAIAPEGATRTWRRALPPRSARGSPSQVVMCPFCSRRCSVTYTAERRTPRPVRSAMSSAMARGCALVLTQPHGCEKDHQLELAQRLLTHPSPSQAILNQRCDFNMASERSQGSGAVLWGRRRPTSDAVIQRTRGYSRAEGAGFTCGAPAAHPRCAPRSA